MKIKNIYTIILLVTIQVFQSCTNDDGDLNFVENIPAPSNLALQVTLSQDNSGLATIIPSGDSASSFIIDFGDGTSSEAIATGTNVSHVYPEGTFELTLTAINLNGDTATFSQPLTVSFFPPENLEITVTPISGDNFFYWSKCHSRFCCWF